MEFLNVKAGDSCTYWFVTLPLRLKRNRPTRRNSIEVCSVKNFATSQVYLLCLLAFIHFPLC